VRPESPEALDVLAINAMFSGGGMALSDVFDEWY
jgi:hypothetical protein